MNTLIVTESSREDVANLAHLLTELGYPSSTANVSRRFENICTDPSDSTLMVESEGQVSARSRIPRRS